MSHTVFMAGAVDNYVEPFAGSLAVLLERPAWHAGITTGAETVNDADAYARLPLTKLVRERPEHGGPAAKVDD